MQHTDIRQCDAWSEYLKIYGWNSLKLTNGSILRFNNFLFTKRASLQLPKNLYANDLQEIDKICKHNKILFLKITPSLGQDLELLEATHYRKSKKIDISPNTILLDLTLSLDELVAKFTSTCRYSIKKAEREKCYTEIIKNPSVAVVSKFHQIVMNRSKKRNFYMYGIDDTFARITAFGENSYIVFVYNSKGEVLGTKLFLGYEDTIYGIHSGTTVLGQKSTAGYKLLMDCIKYFKETGFNTMDLGSVADTRLKWLTHGWLKYSHYKYEFNGRLISYNFPYIKWFW